VKLFLEEQDLCPARLLSGAMEAESMRRVALVAACWFAFWMMFGAGMGYVFGGEHGGKANGLYYGFFNGAWLALLTAFAWPWIMPKVIDDWMNGIEDTQDG
jgi:hypothetical protein